MRFTDDIYYRVNAINGNTNASKKAWVSYDVERLWPAKQLNGVWIKYQDYVWVWVPTDYISFNFQNDAYKQTDYFYVYCIKTN